jgi:hypothetical protein
MAEFKEVPEEDIPETLRQVFMVIQQALDPTASLDEEEKAQVQLLTMIENSFDGDQALRNIADISTGVRKTTAAEIFAGGIMVSLMRSGVIAPHHNITNLYLRQLISYWLQMYEKYINGEEI